ncbi:Shikimate/quinate 5-dehydrogenase I beta [Streptococcus sp. HSISS2]|nr:Shikimate/quinate 5-dehydrogenase I beta [Streptococcus sp. HSISS2]
MDELSPAAQLIGAVNTVVNRDGHLIGHNTDGFGFLPASRISVLKVLI